MDEFTLKTRPSVSQRCSDCNRWTVCDVTGAVSPVSYLHGVLQRMMFYIQRMPAGILTHRCIADQTEKTLLSLALRMSLCNDPMLPKLRHSDKSYEWLLTMQPTKLDSKYSGTVLNLIVLDLGEGWTHWIHAGGYTCNSLRTVEIWLQQLQSFVNAVKITSPGGNMVVVC